MRQHRLKRGACAAMLIAATLLVDQFTKLIARSTLAPSHEHIVAIPGLLNFIYVENRGAAFGMFEGAHLFFIVCALVISCIGVAYLAFGRIKSWCETLSFALIVSGACGNVIDRVFFGFVTDFFALSFVNFPVFNVADICITLGCALLIVSLFLIPSESQLSCSKD